MNFDLWISQNSLTDCEVAARIGVHVVSIGRYRRHERIPHAEAMAKIFEMTGGLVAPNDFYDLPALGVGKTRGKAA